jgi:hypothetical protein
MILLFGDLTNLAEKSKSTFENKQPLLINISTIAKRSIFFLRFVSLFGADQLTQETDDRRTQPLSCVRKCRKRARGRN